MVHISNHVSYTDGQALSLKGSLYLQFVPILASTSATGCCSPVLEEVLKGSRILSSVCKTWSTTWLWIFLLANPEGLNPCSELSFGFGGCTGAAVPVFLHGCPMPPCFPVSAGHYSAFAHGCSPGVCSWWLSPILSLFHPHPDDYAMIKLINPTIWFWRYGFYLEVTSRSPFWPKSTCSPTFPWCWCHPAPLDIFTLIKLSPACAMHESAWDHSETKGVLSSPLWFCIICSTVSGVAFDFPLPVSATYTAGDRLLDYLELWSDPLHFDQTCCYI